MSVREELDIVLFENYRRVGKESGYWGNYFVRDLRVIGGVATLKKMLKPRKSRAFTGGMQALIDAGSRTYPSRARR